MPTFRYSLGSDLHLDHPNPSRLRDMTWLEHVVVPGDTANGLAGVRWLEKMKKLGHKIYAVDGNHEHYSNRERDGRVQRTVEETETRFYALLDQPRSVEVAPGLTIVGTNGWYDPYYYDGLAELWISWMNDYRWIGHIQGKALREYELLNSLLEKTEGRVIVVTHTAPTLDTLVDKPWDPVWQASNNFFHNRFMWQIMRDHGDKIAAWNHGHTHFAQDKVVSGVRVICNPRGYPRENPEWTPVEIEVDY
jgi:hypothetical protein